MGSFLSGMLDVKGYSTLVQQRREVIVNISIPCIQFSMVRHIKDYVITLTWQALCQTPYHLDIISRIIDFLWNWTFQTCPTRCSLWYCGSLWMYFQRLYL